MSTCNLKLLFKDEIPWAAQGGIDQVKYQIRS